MKFISSMINISYEIDGVTGRASLPVERESFYIHQSEDPALLANIAAISWNCMVPELHRLVNKTVDLHELNYLTKRLKSMSVKEIKNFNAQVYIENLNTLREMIDATFDQGKYCLIDSFEIYADKEHLGKELFKEKNLAWTKKEMQETDFSAYADEIQKTCPMMKTPYGILTQFHEETLKLYTETAFPPYADKHSVMIVKIENDIPTPELSSELMLYLPETEDYIQAMLNRIGVHDDTGYSMEVEFESLDEVAVMQLETLDLNNVYEVNKLAEAIVDMEFHNRDLRHFASALEIVPFQTVQDILEVIKHLSSFKLIDDPDPVSYARNYLKKKLKDDSEDIFHMIDPFMDYTGFGEMLYDRYPIKEVTIGYLQYPQDLIDEMKQRYAENDMEIA